MHITLRAAPGAPNLRAELVYRILERSIDAAVRRGHRILHFSVQHNHVHMIVEADDAATIGRRMQRFASRAAQLINLVVRRSGRLWGDRYHRRDVTSPRQMKLALVYVLFNRRKHVTGSDRAVLDERQTLDDRSSTRWFHDWDPRARPPPSLLASDPSPVAAPRTWMARTGWKRHGLIRFDASPSSF